MTILRFLIRLLLCTLILFVYALVLANIVADRCSINVTKWEERQ